MKTEIKCSTRGINRSILTDAQAKLLLDLILYHDTDSMVLKMHLSMPPPPTIPLSNHAEGPLEGTGYTHGLA